MTSASWSSMSALATTRGDHHHHDDDDDTSQEEQHLYDNIEATTTQQWQMYQESRESWYHSMYRLRIRSGIWVAALLASLVVMASSLLLWWDVLVPAASKRMGRPMYMSGVCRAIVGTSSYPANASSSIPPELCVRTAFSITSGALAACLCITAIVIHMSTRHGAAQVMDSFRAIQEYVLSASTTPIQTEFALSVILSILLGLNAVFATGVQGPAATVGNLYYASWLSFLLCLRILLGCLEELYELHHEEQGEGKEQCYSEANANDSSMGGGHGDENSVGGTTSLPTKSVSTDAASNMNPDLFDNERARRSRRYLFLGIVSSICSASALDAALNQSSELTTDQWFVIVAPTVVAILSLIQFAMCLGPITYLYVSSTLIGGTLAVFMFVVWLVDLLITMHSENSWAVNAIGDVKIANIYYFSWASIVTAGLNMSTFVVKVLGIHEKDYVTVVWMMLVKVNFVILGASFHIWYTIRDSCTLDDIQASAIDFCSRTVFAMVVALVGMAIGGLVALTRVCLLLCCPLLVPIRIRSHIEMILSAFLVLVFGVALALITGIGGPGQSVGDLFYATWLAFLVAIGIALTCHAEIFQGAYGDVERTHLASNSIEDGMMQESEANFVQMT